jgi:hypothetical protein
MWPDAVANYPNFLILFRKFFEFFEGHIFEDPHRGLPLVAVLICRKHCAKAKPNAMTVRLMLVVMLLLNAADVSTSTFQ